MDTEIGRRDALRRMGGFLAGAGLAAAGLGPHGGTVLRVGPPDHEEIQRRIDAGGEVVLGPGVHDVRSLRARGKRGLHLRGAGPGRTVLRQAPGRHGQAVVLLDCTECSVSDLTIDSARAEIEGGILVMGGRGVRLENVEIRSADHTSLLVSGPQFGFSQREAYDNVVRRCVVRGQRSWDGMTSTAQIIAGGNARNTLFEDCESHSDGVMPGDLFGFDFAPGTRFVRCLASGHPGFVGHGFWGEGEQRGRHHAELVGCRVHDAFGGVGVCENAAATVRDLTLERIWGTWALWCRSELSVHGAVLDECCQQELPDRSGGILAEAGHFYGERIVFRNSRGAANVNVYRFGDRPRPDETVVLERCVFDRPVSVYKDMGPAFLAVRDSTFLPGADLRAFEAPGARLEIVGNRFHDQGLDLACVGEVEIRGNEFTARRGYDGAAIRAAFCPLSGRLLENTFRGYRAMAAGMLRLDTRGNQMLRG